MQCAKGGRGKKKRSLKTTPFSVATSLLVNDLPVELVNAIKTRKVSASGDQFCSKRKRSILATVRVMKPSTDTSNTD